ncbi:DUF3119 family protein [Euhalothece natronophila Z-M001]|uniref:DUF3119 family protein n=1 Tax=Euhalothece natronophila Z-M001 TaxID=522448 RepID=A0A5B8NT47_9CHRO|nr:DUF3119 family protein [Euhalothece natronophila]QDZ41210.1 DUF3119 family protein [Euhalothece natronophila Z-M001]
MTPTTSSSSSQEATTLAPSYRLPIIIFIIGLGLIFLGNALVFESRILALMGILSGMVIALFSFFLILQAVIIRLKFTETALEVYRSEKMIRRFPYSDWINWKIFWQSAPILFYFKEVNSIHSIPILYDPKSLRDCLEKYCPQQLGS